MPAIVSGITLLALPASEVTKFFAFKSLLGSYKLVLYLKLLLSVGGIITVAVFIFTAVYFIYTPAAHKGRESFSLEAFLAEKIIFIKYKNVKQKSLTPHAIRV